MKDLFSDLLPVAFLGLGAGFVFGVIIFTVIYLSFEF